MKPDTYNHISSSIRSTILASLAAMAWLLSPNPAAGQGALTLANPQWNITLTDAGYSDFLLDNTPGFEGREYLSGEWGAAVSYQVGSQPVTPPQWLEKNFVYPDWTNNSTFTVVSPLTQTGLNADNLPIAQSVIANGALQITLRHEMLDTVVGTPMGVTPASAAGAGNAISSSRYVLKQTCTLKNISGSPISKLQFFQFLHGLNAQRGVYDNRAHAGPLAGFQQDVTLAGVDQWATGTNSSSAGLEDFLGFHGNLAPSAFEIGYYGIEGNGLDDHWIGKPSDGVHLSIEDNWQTAPFNTRQGTDNFAPPVRWVSGAERWELGTLPAGQSVSIDVILSLRTGTKVTTGTNSSGGCNGGSGVSGGVDYQFDDVTGEGSCFGEFSKADAAEIEFRIAQGEFTALNFLTPGGPEQIWKLQFTGTNNGLMHLTFAYDASILPTGFDESTLHIYHFVNGAWQKLEGTVDSARHTIAVTVSSLSPFALGVSGGTTYNINASASGSGTVSGGGTYADGASATLTAMALAGNVFTNWTEGGAVVSASPSLTFIVHSNRTLAANFVSAGGNIVITTSASPANGGSTFGDGAYASGASATVVAAPNPGYKFSKWLVNGASVSTVSNYTFTVSTNRALVAKFKPVYTVTVSADPPNAGAPEADSQQYDPGEHALLTPHPEPGYCLVNWTENGVPVSTDPNYQFNVNANRDLVAHYAYGKRIDANVYLGIGGTADGDGVYQNGASVTLAATPYPGYAFVNWTQNNAPVSTNDTYTFTCTSNRTLFANFAAAAVANTNSAPIASGGNFFQLTGQPLAINIGDLMWNDNDPDGDPITFIGVSATSSNGLALTTNTLQQILVPASTVGDGFSYTIADSHGATAVGTATIAIITNVTSVALSCDLASSPGVAIVNFTGVPWYAYTVQRATNVTFTGTVQSWPTSAGADGAISLWDNFSDLGRQPTQAFYRLQYP